MKRVVFAFLIVLIVGCKKKTTDGTAVWAENFAVDTTKIPVGLPKRLGFGTEGDVSQSSQFIEGTDYQYQYLAGDIFSDGWATWNSPNGEFARAFLLQINKLGRIPVFTYYNIVPAKMRNQDPAFTNLNDAEVMNKYFNDWKLLLQICGNYGKTVIVHYEPDLFGYLEMYQNDATKNTVKVALSNQDDTKGFTNDAKGLAQAIVYMRNKYAPNVLLGWHASQWATGVNVIKDNHNPEQIATETASYYKSLKAPFDLIFSEFSDRDAGYKQVVDGQADTFWSTEPTIANGNLSNYERFRRFIKRLHQETGQKVILWQIPIGNTLSLTCNNASGHYKDNTAQYFLQPLLENGDLNKITQYSESGVIAFLFGRGAESCTSYLDNKKDGTTGTNETADDDGGYLRKEIGRYNQLGGVLLR